MKAMIMRLGAFILASSLLAVGAFAFDYLDQAGTGYSSYSSSTIYDVPVGALVEYGANVYGDGSAGTWVDGCGIDDYETAVPDSGGYYDYANTSEEGDLGYQIWASSNEYSNAYISVSW